MGCKIAFYINIATNNWFRNTDLDQIFSTGVNFVNADLKSAKADSFSVLFALLGSGRDPLLMSKLKNYWTTNRIISAGP